MDSNASCAKAIPYKLLIDEIFDPKENSNIQTNDYMADIIPKLVNALIKELHDPKKATFMHVSS